MEWIAFVSFVLGVGACLGWVAARAFALIRPAADDSARPEGRGWLCGCGTLNEEDGRCLGCTTTGHRVRWQTRDRGEMRR